MKRDYPDYFLDFKCIGGACEDSCCIGWEVDIDEASYYYYQALEGPFGDLIRSRIRQTPEGDYYFPMVEKKRCPFLNQENLCDMIIGLGDGALCVTCDEYPRYFNVIGDYEQIDISLSCMEAGRLLFTNPEPVQYLHEEEEEDWEAIAEDWDEDPTHWEDGQLHWEEASDESFDDDSDADISIDEDYQDKNPDDDPEVDIVMRDSIIRERDQMIEVLQDRSTPLQERLEKAILKGCCNKVTTLWATPLEVESDQQLMKIYKPLQPIDSSWKATYQELCNLAADEKSLAEAKQLFYQSHGAELALWFEKLAVYFIFRYQLDSYYDSDSTGARRLTLRSLQMILLMLILRWCKKDCTVLTIHDMIDVAHIYSRQVEHCEENVDELKR